MTATRSPQAPRFPTLAAVALVVMILCTVAATGVAYAAPPKQRVAAAEARAVTRQALAQTAALIDARKVAVRSCTLTGDRARCVAVMRGRRQTLEAVVAIRELRDDYVVRVLRIS